MPKEYIITMTAANRVGILAAVTNAMAELDADLKEARQTVVRRFFTMIFSAEFPKSRASMPRRAALPTTTSPAPDLRAVAATRTDPREHVAARTGRNPRPG